MPDTVVSLRHATDQDQAFLERLFCATRIDDLAGLDQATQADLLARQFRAQRRALAERFDPGGDHIITEHDLPVGRLWVHSDETEWELVDIAVVPERQNWGIASVLIDDLVTRADAAEVTVRLVVRIDNIGAQRLYFRHGFEVESANETDIRMRRIPISERLRRFERVRQAVLADEVLHSQLRSAGPEAFAATVVDLAHELGMELDAGDVREARRAAKTDWLTRWV